jgi:hypothetical protein
LPTLPTNSIRKLIARRSLQGMSACSPHRGLRCPRCPGVNVSMMSWQQTRRKGPLVGCFVPPRRRPLARVSQTEGNTDARLVRRQRSGHR